MMDEDKNKYDEIWDKIKFEWEMTEDHTKQVWDNIVDRIIETYREGKGWTDGMIREAKDFFKGRFGDMNANSEDEMRNDNDNNLYR